jgi:hypothetical protein
MKTIFSILKFGFVGMLILTGLKSCNNLDYVSKNQFIKAHAYLNKRVDTVIANQKQMQHKIDSIVNILNRLEKNQQYITYSIDTLKAGQVLIYSVVTDYRNNNEVKENWARKLLNWLQ